MSSRSPAAALPDRLVEAACAALVLLLGLGTRLAFVHGFPTVPFSDFSGVIEYALAFRDQSLHPPGYYWDVFNVGPAMVLSVVLRLFPDDPAATARVTTVVWTGLMGVYPFLLWRGAVPRWARTLTGCLLALWPGQIAFSGVVAQDNWVTPPTVAVVALAARALIVGRRRDGDADAEEASGAYPLAAGALWALAVSMRQEMLYALAPCALAGAGLLRLRGWRWRPLLVFALAAGLPFFAMAMQRRAATGELALSSAHFGYTLLGTVAPGATRLGWIDPVSYVASVDPELAADRHLLIQRARHLALDEVRRRPGFQLLRALDCGLRLPLLTDSDILYWSIGPHALPPALQARAEAFSRSFYPFLRRQSLLVLALFLAALVVAVRQRSWVIFVVASAVVLKVGLHAVLVFSPRFLVPATAAQLVTIGLGAWEASRLVPRRLALVALLAGGVGAAAVADASPRLHDWVLANDLDPQRVYRFTLLAPGGRLDCRVGTGRLTALGADVASVEPLTADASVGPIAVASCELGGDGSTALALEVEDGLPGPQPEARLEQRVALDGQPVWSRDLATTENVQRLPLGPVAAGRSRRVELEMRALSGSSPGAWGEAAKTTFRLVAAGPPSGEP